MRKLLSLLVIALLVSCTGVAQKTEKKEEKKYKISKTDDEWKKILTREQFYISRKQGTERAFTGEYWNNKKKTAETISEGWLNTGDTYHQDEDGYFIYGGRSDDMMKVGGIWCSPFEIEAKLVEHPKVLEAAVVGRKNQSGLIKPEAHVVLLDGIEPSGDTTDELLQLCKSGLAPYKYPRWVKYLKELPKTATGKIQRYKLR